MSKAAASNSTAARALSQAEFDVLMDGCGQFGNQPQLAIAVSGGPDSMALTHFLNEWVKARSGKLFAITVDHQLRTESGDEAAQVNAWCKKSGIEHVTLVWEKEKRPSSAVHEQARDARYDLMTRACKERGITHLFLAHHADDQAETVLMRFMKGSGVDGLAGMPRTRKADGITLVRPLLPVSKTWLEQSCTAHKLPFVRDPSNQSPNYLRSRLRGLMEPLAQEGMTTASLYEIAYNAGMARAALEAVTNDWLAAHAKTDPLGFIQVELKAWKELGDEMRRRTLIRILLCMSGEDYPPKNTALDYLVDALLTKETPHQTLCGCHIIVQFGMMKFYREEIAVLKGTDTNLWDNRFKIMVDASLLSKNTIIAPLRNIGRDTLEKMGHKQVAECAALHRATLPAIYVDNQFHSVPDFFPSIDAAKESQTLVKAIFLPKRMLIIDCFDNCPILLT